LGTGTPDSSKYLSGDGSWKNNAIQRFIFTATSGQTTFNVAYGSSVVDVYLNGVKLLNVLDYSADNGTSVILSSGAAVGDNIEIVYTSTFDVANTYSISQSDFLLSNKQDNLVSGTNIKTINGESILGSGNISAPVTSNLATGLLKNTTTTGALTIAVPGTDYVTPSGNVATATTLATPRNINGVSFNGSANITIVDNTKEPTFTTLPVNKGGTGAGTLTGLVKGNGTGAFSVAAPGTDYQTPLVSGTSIKTINGVHLLGSGDITISASPTVVLLTSGTSWTVPADVTKIKVTCVGGGGGGGSRSESSSYPDKRGGAGAGVSVSILSVTPGSVIPYVIGIGGVGIAAFNNSPGNDGGTTTFSSLTATGGGGATYGLGSGGVGAGGNILNLSGGIGLLDNSIYSVGGLAGIPFSYYGRGGASRNNVSAGENGGQGLIIIEY
jgi:hypothetical protein